MFNTKELGDLALVILRVVPWDTQIVGNFDIVLLEIVEDCRGVWRGLDDADKVIKVVVKIEPKQLGFEDPKKSFTENVEKKR